MHATILAMFEFSRTVASMSGAAIVLFLIALWAVKTDIAQACGIDKVVALSNLCFALPLAVFGAEHLSAANGIAMGVPSFVPWHLFWAYFVGFALLAASLSIATKIQVQWSGLMFGIMMFLFVAMMDIPGVLHDTKNRFSWALMLRELAFGGGGWLLAAGALRKEGRVGTADKLATVGRVVVGIASIFWGVETFLHPLGMPGIPLEKLMSDWIPARPLIGYLTAAILVVAGAAILLAQKTRMAATYLGTWIVLLVVFVYGPILIEALMNPGTDVKVEGLNYFFDTLLWAGTALGLASATPNTD
jgi:hypothetical protein